MRPLRPGSAARWKAGASVFRTSPGDLQLRGCPSPKPGINAMRLIFRDVDAKVPRHGQSDLPHVAIYHSPHRPQRRPLGECRFAPAVDDSQVGAEAPPSGSTVLDRAHEDRETMENGTRHRTTRYCCELATPAPLTNLNHPHRNVRV